MTRFNVPHSREPVLSGALFTQPWARYFQEVWRKIGGGRNYNLGGTLFDSTTSVGNVGSGEDDLITYSLERNELQNIGDVIEIIAFGTTAANANNKTIKLILGSTELFSTGVVVLNNKDWYISSKIIRTGSATQKCITTFSGDTSLVTQTTDYISGTEDFTTQLTIKCTGEAISDNDIVQEGLIINLFPVR